jgi:hypothetical protein
VCMPMSGEQDGRDQDYGKVDEGVVGQRLVTRLRYPRPLHVVNSLLGPNSRERLFRLEV